MGSSFILVERLVGAFVISQQSRGLSKALGLGKGELFKGLCGGWFGVDRWLFRRVVGCGSTYSRAVVRHMTELYV